MAKRTHTRWPAGLVLCLVALTASTGCPVVEVINDIGKPISPTPAAEEPSAEVVPDGTAPEGNAQAKLKAYYNRKPRRKAEADPNNPIVQCRTKSGTQFVRKYDCELRGGRVAS